MSISDEHAMYPAMLMLRHAAPLIVGKVVRGVPNAPPATSTSAVCHRCSSQDRYWLTSHENGYRPATSIDESMMHAGPPHESNEGYAYAKRMVVVQNGMYASQFGSAFTSVVPTNVFGKHDTFHLAFAHVIPAMIHKCHLAMQEGADFVVLGSGAPRQQFIFSKDLARLMLWTLRSYDEPDPIIRSMGEEDEVSIGEVAAMVAAAMGYTKELKFDTAAADGQFKKTASNAKLRRYLPDFQFTPIHEALKRRSTGLSPTLTRRASEEG